MIPTTRDWFVVGLTILALSFVSHIPVVGSAVKFVLGF